MEETLLAKLCRVLNLYSLASFLGTRVRRIRCALKKHELKPHKAVVSGASLRYAIVTPGYIVIQKVCVRPGCTFRTSQFELCPIILQKPREKQF